MGCTWWLGGGDADCDGLCDAGGRAAADRHSTHTATWSSSLGAEACAAAGGRKKGGDVHRECGALCMDVDGTTVGEEMVHRRKWYMHM